MTTRPPERRRWKVRFSLRSLLVATLVFGCGLGWSVSEMRRAKRQQEAVAHIRSVRGHATYDYQINAAGESRTNRHPPGPAFFRSLVGDDFLCHVQRVSIHHARDRDLQAVGQLSQLNDLRLNTRYVTDEGVSHLRGLRNLEHLDLWCNQVTDQGLQHISDLERLATLSIYGTQVSDAGLVHLRGLKNLRVLKVRDTQVTAAGAASLEELLPDCEISGVEGSD